MHSDDFIHCLGKRDNSPEIQQMLASVGFVKKLRMPRDDIDARVERLKQGFSLVFVPADDRSSVLVFSCVQFYSDVLPFYKKFTGVLPRGILFSDSREEVARKLGKPIPTKRPGPFDAWRLDDGFVLAIDYQDDRILALSMSRDEDAPLEDDTAKVPLKSADELVGLLGLPADAPQVAEVLAQFAHGAKPELDPDDEDALVDWVSANEIGLELGFEDQAYALALPEDRRRKGPLLLTQLYFYGKTAQTRAFPHPLPFGLDFSDDRAAVRKKLSAHETLRRSFVRDAWHLPDFMLTVAYRPKNGRLESVLCQRPPAPWPVRDDDATLVAPFTAESFFGLFGLAWSSARLRAALEPLGYARVMGDARGDGTADLSREHGIAFGFAPGRQVAAADREDPETPTLATVTLSGPRVHDAREWVGPMPLGLSFDDSQADIAAKVARTPDERDDFDRSGFALWHYDACSLRTEYSTVENRLLRVTLMAPGYWQACGAGDDD